MKSINALCWWIEHTAVSQIIQSVAWIVPTVQTIHIAAIAVVAASALMIDLRLISVFSADRPVKEISARFLPFVWWPLLVLLMTGPGLALFYGGLVRRKNVLSTMMQSFILMAAVSVLWAIVGYSLAFGEGNAFKIGRASCRERV